MLQPQSLVVHHGGRLHLRRGLGNSPPPALPLYTRTEASFEGTVITPVSGPVALQHTRSLNELVPQTQRCTYRRVPRGWLLRHHVRPEHQGHQGPAEEALQQSVFRLRAKGRWAAGSPTRVGFTRGRWPGTSPTPPSLRQFFLPFPSPCFLIGSRLGRPAWVRTPPPHARHPTPLPFTQGPQYVCLDVGSFVCTNCSGVL